ncbi:ferrochelatase [Sandaracinobacteroides hominis]|uniref:ferrochelatase n=1 Tax=Sandaracinobacteroides hominis TaxID=2780086 RepID=UPI0018F2D548|nr:ferrochelatase [Sandaracinobacteroides hominis]
MARPPGHPPAPAGRVGLLLVNLGSPDSPDAPSVRRYLDQFLSDPRVVEIPRIIWQPILKLFVLTRRPKVSAANYAKIWDREANESPLKLITRLQSEALQGAFGPEVIVDHAMRYGSPAIGERLAALRAQGCDRICVAPLYPQYSGATTGSVLDEVFDVLRGERWMPALRTMPPYHDHPAHIAALKTGLERGLAKLDFVPDRILLSFHGMPKRTLELGDPYHCQCQKTARLLRESTGRSEAEMPIGFQSLFGRAEWLKPYTLPLLEEMAGSGFRRVAVLMPGFSADCVETLEEIAVEAREAFLAAGGTHFAALPCLNDSDEGMEMLQILLRESLAGWVGAD